ncbi:hypothetical protein [Paenibacillus sp. HJGM_3]|uniref:hypothetical protein n=1 Tax=Paenibacillus sp. HJGM_3 TaxID=3379816 RepID=UPI00385DAD02
MTGRNSRPDNNGPAGHPSRIDQYRSEFPTDMQRSLGEDYGEEYAAEFGEEACEEE